MRNSCHQRVDRFLRLAILTCTLDTLGTVCGLCAVRGGFILLVVRVTGELLGVCFLVERDANFEKVLEGIFGSDRGGRTVVGI